jgi:hypothetical protein
MADTAVEVTVTAQTGELQAALQQAAQAAATAFAAIKQAAIAANGQIGDSTHQATTQAVKEWQQAFKPIESGFTTMLKGMLIGHQSFQQALQRGVTTLLNSEIDADVKRLAHWLSTQAAEVAAKLSADEAKQASDAAASGSSLALMALKAIKAIFNDAAQAFAGVFAFLSPTMGPAAAGPAAAASATVASVAGAVTSAAGGLWTVPRDMLAMVHVNESILPANVAGPMRRFFEGGVSAGADAGGTYNITIQAIDTQTGAQFLKNNARSIVAALHAQARSFHPALRPS